MRFCPFIENILKYPVYILSQFVISSLLLEFSLQNEHEKKTATISGYSDDTDVKKNNMKHNEQKAQSTQHPANQSNISV